MRLFIIIVSCFLTAILVNCQTINQTEPEEEVVEEDEIETRILGGRLATENEFTYQVSIQHFTDESTQKFCGGVIIHPLWILTAAHCMDEASVDDDIRINAGVKNAFDYSQQSQVIKVRKAFLHPKYDPAGVNYDIALLKLRKKLKFGPNVQPISLPSTDYVPQSTGIILGWGRIDKYETIEPEELMVADDMPLSKHKDCIKYFGKAYIKKNMLCIGANFHKNACSGDSGGPYVQLTENHVPVVVGVASFGADKCDERPMVYTNVTRFLNFIKKTIKKRTDDDA